MRHDWKPISLDKVTTYPLRERKSKVSMDALAIPWNPGGAFKSWLQSLPKILAAQDFTEVSSRWIEAVLKGKTILLGMGAHPIKVGLSPIILDLMDRGLISGLALNGAGVIHDVELAMAGSTSEDVAAHIGTGQFGMAEETGRFLNQAISEGAAKGFGLGQCVGECLTRSHFPYTRHSLLAQAFERGIPVTVHVAMGTDIIHSHPSVDGAAIGKTSHRDYLVFARLVSTLEHGVFINLGSAVIIPEVFLKALSLARNLGHTVRCLTTVNMDFISHYRPMTNVVHRPTLEGGKGFNLIGHHEIMFPLLVASVIEGMGEVHSK